MLAYETAFYDCLLQSKLGGDDEGGVFVGMLGGGVGSSGMYMGGRGGGRRV